MLRIAESRINGQHSHFTRPLQSRPTNDRSPSIESASGMGSRISFRSRTGLFMDCAYMYACLLWSPRTGVRTTTQYRDVMLRHWPAFLSTSLASSCASGIRGNRASQGFGLGPFDGPVEVSSGGSGGRAGRFLTGVGLSPSDSPVEVGSGGSAGRLLGGVGLNPSDGPVEVWSGGSVGRFLTGGGGMKRLRPVR